VATEEQRLEQNRKWIAELHVQACERLGIQPGTAANAFRRRSWAAGDAADAVRVNGTIERASAIAIAWRPGTEPGQPSLDVYLYRFEQESRRWADAINEAVKAKLGI
jgi:hypothetical protein